MIIVTADQMQKMDKTTIDAFGLPGLILMENAARGAVDFFTERYEAILPGEKIGIIAGRGNNGGDGFVMARYLSQKGLEVVVYLLSKKAKVTGDAKANLDLLGPINVPIIEIPDQSALNKNLDSMKTCGIWIDAILGTGLNSNVRGFFKTAIEFLNQSGKPIFAVDMPSGLNSDTGKPMGMCVKADASATFGFAKTGHAVYPGRELSGETRIVDIGIPGHVVEAVAPFQELVDWDFAAGLLEERQAQAHKGTTGHALIIAGSTGKTGAAALTANSAVRAGAGLVTLAVPESTNQAVEALVVEPMTAPVPCSLEGSFSFDAFSEISALARGKKAIAAGPGMGTSYDVRKLLIRLLWEYTVPVVIDADGLNILANDTHIFSQLKNPLILTPHPGEMAKLTGLSTQQIQDDRVKVAREFAIKHGVILLLKGAATITAAPDGMVLINSTGNSGMASGGMGDALTGIITGLLAQGLAPTDAAALGAFIHGAAADILYSDYGPVGYSASDLSNCIPTVVKSLFELKSNHQIHSLLKPLFRHTNTQ